MCSYKITISEEAYQKLLSLKQKDETWSEVIMRITQKNIDKLREKSKEKLRSQIGMIPGAPTEISKDEIWKEFIKEKEDR